MGITKQPSSRAKVSSKGWVVIPVELRRKYHIESGDEVEIVDYGGVLGLVPKHRGSMLGARGLLAGSSSLTEALLRERRHDREKEKG